MVEVGFDLGKVGIEEREGIPIEGMMGLAVMIEGWMWMVEERELVSVEGTTRTESHFLFECFSTPSTHQNST